MVSPVTSTSYTLTATGAGGTASANTTVTINPAPPPPPVQGVVTIVGSASVDRGEQASFTVTLTNTGEVALIGVELTFQISPSRRIRKINPGSPIAIADVPAGGSVSQTWQGDADKEGSATVTAAAFSGGISVGTVTQTLTVVK